MKFANTINPQTAAAMSPTQRADRLKTLVAERDALDTSIENLRNAKKRHDRLQNSLESSLAGRCRVEHNHSLEEIIAQAKSLTASPDYEGIDAEAVAKALFERHERTRMLGGHIFRKIFA